MQFLHDSFVTFLDRNSLRFFYELSETTTITSLIETITRDMARSDKKWEFGTTSISLRQLLHSHENLPLHLLGLTNRGIARPGSPITLRRQPPNSTLTVADLLAEKNLFSKPHLCIQKGRLIVRFGKPNFGFVLHSTHITFKLWPSRVSAAWLR